MRIFLISFLLFCSFINVKANVTELITINDVFLFEKDYSLYDSTDSVAKVFKKGHSKYEIISIPKGKRPLPSNYLKWRYRHRHQRNFRRGASFLIPKYILDKYGRATLGRQDGLFVMSRKEMDDLLQKANGKLAFIETELGIPAGLWNNTVLLRIDIRRPKRLHLRIPSGNETGANELWIPGGKLPNGYLESVVDPVPEGKYVETVIILK